MKEKYNFREATIQDISQMVAIENEFFNNGVAFDEKILKKWLQYNSKMFYVVTNNKEDVLAFTILVPISKNLYTNLKEGKVRDLVDFNENEVLTSLQSEHYYVADIASSNKSIKASLILFKGIVNFLSENAHWVLATPITKEGFTVCTKFGFKPLESDFKLGKNLELEVTDSLRKRFIKKRKKG